MALFLMLIFLGVIFLCDSCSSFNQSACQHLGNTTFAVEEMNSNSDLLFSFTLDCLKAESCLAKGTTLLAAMTMVTRD